MENERKEGLGDIGTKPNCRSCGSERVAVDAWACWNAATGLWELEITFDDAHCHQCEGPTKLDWKNVEAVPDNRVRDLNDAFRRGGKGNGSLMITSGVQALGGAFAVTAIQALRAFASFDTENDPWGEHDFGAFEVDGTKLFFKFDYYAPDLKSGSENPGNPAQTHRVLTLMLPQEY